METLRNHLLAAGFAEQFVDLLFKSIPSPQGKLTNFAEYMAQTHPQVLYWQLQTSLVSEDHRQQKLILEELYADLHAPALEAIIKQGAVKSRITEKHLSAWMIANSDEYSEASLRLAETENRLEILKRIRKILYSRGMILTNLSNIL